MHMWERESEEAVGKYGWGSRNREGQDLVEMLARNQLVVVNSFFQKRESHKITYRSADCQKLSAKQGQRLQGFGRRAHNEPT